MKKESKTKKVIAKVKEVFSKPEEVKGITNDEFLQSKPQTFANDKCKVCGGAGLARPTFVNSEFCGNCRGTGLEPLTE